MGSDSEVTSPPQNSISASGRSRSDDDEESDVDAGPTQAHHRDVADSQATQPQRHTDHPAGDVSGEEDNTQGNATQPQAGNHASDAEELQATQAQKIDEFFESDDEPTAKQGDDAADAKSEGEGNGHADKDEDLFGSSGEEGVEIKKKPTAEQAGDLFGSSGEEDEEVVKAGSKRKTAADIFSDGEDDAGGVFASSGSEEEGGLGNKGKKAVRSEVCCIVYFSHQLPNLG